MATSISPLHKQKLVFLGDQSVGKTSIITRFMFDTFDASYEPTIGIDFLTKSLNVEDGTVRLQLWDTAGQERFRSLSGSYIRDSSAAVVVYDVTSRESFLNAASWIEDVRLERGRNAIIVLVGNKTDLVEKRKVAMEEGDHKAKEADALFLETSAKAGHNIKALFQKIAMSVHCMARETSSKRDDLIDVDLNPIFKNATPGAGKSEKVATTCEC